MKIFQYLATIKSNCSTLKGIFNLWSIINKNLIIKSQFKYRKVMKGKIIDLYVYIANYIIQLQTILII